LFGDESKPGEEIHHPDYIFPRVDRFVSGPQMQAIFVVENLRSVAQGFALQNPETRHRIIFSFQIEYKVNTSQSLKISATREADLFPTN
jgi:hypothetical protein